MEILCFFKSLWLFIKEISPLASVLIAGAALASAYTARKGFNLAIKSNDARIYLEMMNTYSSEEFKKALQLLRNTQTDNPGDFASKWHEHIQLTNNEDKNYKSAILVDDARTKVKYFYRNLAQLYKEELISYRLVKAVCSLQGWRILIDVVEPMEKLKNKNYNRTTYDIIKKAGEEGGHEAPSTQ